MAASVPQIPKIVTFSLATVSFKEDVINLAIVPDGDTEVSVLTLDGVTHKEVTQGGWSIKGTAVQDWDSARPGFAYYCYTHRGETVAFIYSATGTAESAGSPKFTGSCVLSPISYGGDGNVFAESEFSFPITGTLVLDATP
jgi:hypothetical protein